MAFTENYNKEFHFAGHDVELEGETLPGEAANYIRDLIRKDDYAGAEVALLGVAIRKLKVDGQVVLKNNRRGSQRARQSSDANHLPPIMDQQTYESLTDRLLAIVVSQEWWLAKKEPFSDAFEDYLDEDEDSEGETPKENPTLRLSTGDQTAES